MSTRPDPAAGGDAGGTQTDSEADDPDAPPQRRAEIEDAAALPIRARDRYERLGEHARGGLGKITRARDRELGRSLAIKEIQAPDVNSVARFVREAQITMRLEHPAIVPVHDAGRWESGEPFYAMKLVSGRTLKEVVLGKKTLEERMGLLPNIIAVVDAMAYAHDQGIIHRDLKASNVLIGAFGETIVIDWGLAKDLRRPDQPPELAYGPYRRNGDTTVAGAVVGTPSFMPPEQARGEEVDARADVYALGALLYYALSGRAPHEGVDSAEVLSRVRAGAPIPVRELVPAVPSDLADIVGKAMARDKAARYPSAAELADDLKRFQTGQMVAAHAYSWMELAGRWVRRHRAIAATTVLFVLVAAGALLVFGMRESRLRRVAEAERDRADQKTLVLLEQQGRAELQSGRPFRAAVFLSDAFKRNPASTTLRALLTQAVRPMASFERQLLGHSHDVPDVAYSPDGTRILTASTDKTARIWSADTGALLHVLQHDGAVDAAGFSPDGKLVVTGALDDTVRIWDAASGALLRTFADANAYRVSFTPDGARLVIGNQTGQVRIRDALSGAVLSSLDQHRDRIYDIAYSPDRRTMAIASFDRSVSFWDLATLSLLRVMKDFDREVSSVAYSHDGRRLITAESDVDLHVRDAATGERLMTIRMPEGARWPRAAFSPDDREIVTTAHDGIARIWHATSGLLLRTIDMQPVGKLMQSSLRPGGRELATAGSGGSVFVWAIGDSPGYRILDAPTGRAENLYPCEYTVDGTRILAGGTEGTVSVFDAASTKLVSSFKVPGEAFSLAASKDGSRILASGTLKACLPPGLWDSADRSACHRHPWSHQDRLQRGDEPRRLHAGHLELRRLRPFLRLADR